MPHDKDLFLCWGQRTLPDLGGKRAKTCPWHTARALLSLRCLPSPSPHPALGILNDSQREEGPLP